MVRHYFYLYILKAQLSGPPSESVGQLTSFKTYWVLLKLQGMLWFCDLEPWPALSSDKQ